MSNPKKSHQERSGMEKTPLVSNELGRNLDSLIHKFTEAHLAFMKTFCKALAYAKVAGEVLLKVGAETGLKGPELFAEVRKRAEVIAPSTPKASDRTCYLYQRIGSRWNQLQVVAGDNLSDLSLSQAAKLLQVSKEEKPKPEAKDKATASSGQEQTQTDATATTSASTSTTQGETATSPEQAQADKGETEGDTAAAVSASTAQGETATASGEAQESEGEKAINVPVPFDQPDKDRLATMYAQNGPAPTPVQLMTNLVIPSLKKVGEVEVKADEVPFLANAIKEAQALIEALKQKYAIV